MLVHTLDESVGPTCGPILDFLVDFIHKYRQFEIRICLLFEFRLRARNNLTRNTGTKTSYLLFSFLILLMRRSNISSPCYSPVAAVVCNLKWYT